MQLYGSLSILWHCLSLGLEWKLTFSSPVATAEFSRFVGILAPFTALSFRIWNSSTGILSPLLALFIVMLPKVHLTSHCKMSGSRWVITPSWLSGSWSQVGLRKHHYKQSESRWWNSRWAISNSERCCCESAALNMPIWKSQQWSQDWKRSVFIPPKERQCQRMLKLPHNCTHLTL